MIKETFVGLEEAYKKAKERVDNPNLFYQNELRKERNAKGLCESCGKKKITKSQKKRGLVNCNFGRSKKRNNERNNNRHR